MAGWTYTGDVMPVGINRKNPDGGKKVAAFPALGAATEAGWWQEFVWQVERDFCLRAERENPSLATIKVSANNGGSGDTNGVGTLTITIITT